MNRRLALMSLGFVGALTVATPATAHVNLVKASPAQNAAGATPAAIQLEFSGRVEPRFSGLDLLRADGAKIPVAAGPTTADGRTVTAKVDQPLSPGAYKVVWRIVSTDGHRMTGDYSFTVR